MMPTDQTRFVQKITAIYGDRGRAWLDSLPAVIAECESRWSLTVGDPFRNLSYNYVTPAVTHGNIAVVLKVGGIHPEFITEVAALRAYDGDGAVRIIEADVGRGAIVVERLQPGRELAELGDDEAATRIAAWLMSRLWRKPIEGHPYPTVERYTCVLDAIRETTSGDVGPFPAWMVDAAVSLLRELLKSSPEPVLLHGDLHHHNILSAEREPWLVIDPKGVVGDPAFDVGAWLQNPMPWLLDQPDAKAIQERRIRQFSAELGIDGERLRKWGFVYAVLSGLWSAESGNWDGVERMVRCAELFGIR